MADERTLAESLRPGVYRYHGRYYLFEHLCRAHGDDELVPADTLFVAYTPLWTDPDYRGARTSLRRLENFVENFEYVGVTYEGEPIDSSREPCDGASEGA